MFQALLFECTQQASINGCKDPSRKSSTETVWKRVGTLIKSQQVIDWCIYYCHEQYSNITCNVDDYLCFIDSEAEHNADLPWCINVISFEFSHDHHCQGLVLRLLGFCLCQKIWDYILWLTRDIQNQIKEILLPVMDCKHVQVEARLLLIDSWSVLHFSPAKMKPAQKMNEWLHEILVLIL